MKATNWMSFSLTLRVAETSLLCRPYAAKLAQFCALLLLFSSLAASARSAPGGKAEENVSRLLKRRANIQWTGAPLRDALVRLGTVFDLPLFIDRRVNPEWTVTLSLEKMPLEEVLRQAADQHSLGVTIVGPVVYIGPASVAEKLPQLIESRRQLLASAKPAVRRRFQKAIPIDWARLTEPRQLLTDTSENRSLTFVNPAAVPHDLWPAGSLPAMSWGDQLTLLLFGFDQTWELDPVSTISWRVVRGIGF